mgnify:CR=1 FL=1
MVEPERIRHLNSAARPTHPHSVVYWMQAAQRAVDNPALWHAAAEADRLGLPLRVVFVLADYPGATAPQYRWMLSGLAECAAVLREAGIGFQMASGKPVEIIPAIACDAALVVCDRSPARWPVQAKVSIAARLKVPVVEVDGESVIPEAKASGKQEWSARTLRSKISGAVEVYASRPPLPVPSPRHDARSLGLQCDDSAFHCYDREYHEAYNGDRSAEQQYPFVPGSRAALAALDKFVEDRLDTYDNDRNDPLKPGTSGLSTYLHFGQISPIGVIRAARMHGGPGLPAFSEQLVVRRELCRNFIRYRISDYDAWEGLPAWSRATLEAAAGDRRAYQYTRGEFEASATHDRYWNAAQEQLVRTGTIHNYMRMYWGKMILAWSASPREA